MMSCIPCERLLTFESDREKNGFMKKKIAINCEKSSNLPPLVCIYHYLCLFVDCTIAKYSRVASAGQSFCLELVAVVGLLAVLTILLGC